MTLSRIPSGVIAPVKAKTAEIIAATGSAVTHVWGYATTPDHNNRRCVDFMVASKASGDITASYIWANRRRLGLRLIIWYGRIIRTYNKPGIPAGTWARYTGPNPHRDHPHVEFDSSAYRAPSILAPARKPGWYTVRANGGLYGLAGPAPAAVKFLRPNGFHLWIVRWVTGDDGRVWAVTRYGTHYSVDYLKAGKL